MKIRKILGFLAFLTVPLPSFPHEQVCKEEHERWTRVEGGYLELLGVMKGVIYVYSLDFTSPEVCLPDEAEVRISAIGEAMKSKPADGTPIAMGYIFTRTEAHQFLKRYFPCNSKPLPHLSK
jgi:hypothetical protein